MGCWTRPRQTPSPKEAGEKAPARLFPKQEGRLGDLDVRRGRAGATESGAEDIPSAAQCAPAPAGLANERLALRRSFLPPSRGSLADPAANKEKAHS